MAKVVTPKRHPPVNIIWDNCLMAISPAPQEIIKKLTYQEKRFIEEKKPGQRFTTKKIKYFEVPLYSVLMEDPFTIRTYSGLLDRVIKFLVEEGYTIGSIDDTRPPGFPEPRLDLMHGFRFEQKPLLSEFLMKKRNGLLVAPTRYGKSTCIKNTCRSYPGLTTVVTVPGIDLVEQLYEDLKESLPHRKVVLLGGKKPQCEDISVVSMDSLHKCDPGQTDLVLIDEPHAIVTNSRAQEIVKFDKARKLGFGATVIGRFDGRDSLIEGLIGPVLVQRTFQEAVAEGAICQIVVYMVKVPFDVRDAQYTSRDKAYDGMLLQSERIAELVANLCRRLIPPDWQTLAFIEHEKQGNLFLSKIGEEGTLVMAKQMTKTERREKMARMQDGSIKRCLATEIYSTGVTFSDLKVVINAMGGGANISGVQKPGRLAEIRPNKKIGVMIDFLFECCQAPLDETMNEAMRRETAKDANPTGAAWWDVVRDSWSRLGLYKQRGYKVHVVENYAQLKTLFQEEAL